MHIEVITGKEMQAIPQPDGVQWPDDSLHVISRYDDGRLQARMSLIALPHIEGTWVSDELRGTTAGARLLARMEEEVRKLGRTHVFAYALESQPEIGRYLERSGYERQPLTVYAKEIQKCQ